MKAKPVKKAIVRTVSGLGVYHTIKFISGKATKQAMLSYRDAIKQGYGMTRKTASQMVDQLCRTAKEEGITALVVFFDDPHKEYKKTLSEDYMKKATPNKKVAKKKTAKKK